MNHDEPVNYVNSNYVSAPEACWRIFALPMHKQSHTIVKLAVYLPNKQPVMFYEYENEDTLMQWMET